MKKLLAIFLMTFLFAQSAFAANSVMSDEIDKEVQNYVDAIFSSNGSDIFLFVTAILTFLFFMCVVIELVKFINGNADWIAFLALVFLYFATVALIASYGPFTQVIKGVFEGLGETFQFLIVGSRDKMFLSNFIDNVITKAVQAPDVGFTDSIYMWCVTIIWGVVSLLLQVAFYLADVYVTLGYALARIIGVLFVPFLVA
ncbi:conjugal transfer protein TrbL, partial [Enterobacter sp. CM29]|nr:conjugal transfer protein TrbL [Enterobacter sp. CM29]